MSDADFADSLASQINAALEAAERSPDVRNMEPHLIEIVRLVGEDAVRRAEAARALVALLPEIECRHGVIDLLEYCVHALPLPEVVDAATRRAALARLELSEGSSLRPWHTARLCDLIVEASAPGWDGREMYNSLTNETPASS